MEWVEELEAEAVPDLDSEGVLPLILMLAEAEAVYPAAPIRAYQERCSPTMPTLHLRRRLLKGKSSTF
jgi:hypothetical protein